MVSRSLLVCFVLASIVSVGIWTLSGLETNTKVMLVACTYWFALVVLMTFNAPYLISRIYSSIDLEKDINEVRKEAKREYKRRSTRTALVKQLTEIEKKEEAEIDGKVLRILGYVNPKIENERRESEKNKTRE